MVTDPMLMYRFESVGLSSMKGASTSYRTVVASSILPNTYSKEQSGCVVDVLSGN